MASVLVAGSLAMLLVLLSKRVAAAWSPSRYKGLLAEGSTCLASSDRRPGGLRLRLRSWERGRFRAAHARPQKLNGTRKLPELVGVLRFVWVQ